MDLRFVIAVLGSALSAPPLGVLREQNILQLINYSKGLKMRQVFIDKFIIPESSFAEFSERMNYNREFIKKISGFIRDKVYKTSDEQGNILIITIAEWEDELSLAKAKELVQSEYKRINFNPAEFMSKLNVKMERGTYQELDKY